MVNYFRTLLLNMRPANNPGPGEEYVPSTYIPISYPQYLLKARQAIFGQVSDRVGMNLVIARLLNYLHTTQFADDATLNDTRITYDPANITDVFTQIGSTYTTVSGLDPVAWNGEESFVQTGRAYGAWHIVIDGSKNYTIICNDGNTESGTASTITLGDIIPLIGSNLGMVVPTTIAGTWDVELLVPPSHSFASAAEFEPASNLFNSSASTNEEAWYAVWSDVNQPAPLRACTLALAFAQRAHELHLLRNI